MIFWRQITLLQINLLWLCVNQIVESVNLTKFPDNFQFGAATSSYQIEGAWNTSGKGINIWDYGVHNFPNNIVDGLNADVSCDSYHKMTEDIAMLKLLKVDGYRFSISWTRLFPLGYATKLNADGVRYYNELINSLLQNGIQPWVTMYHWDLPQTLQDIGGWTNPMIADIFTSYADKLLQLFGDRVKLWYTINEPANHCIQMFNFSDAPFLVEDGLGTYLCAHNILRAHAKTYRLFERKYKKIQRSKMGIVIDSSWFDAVNESSIEDQRVAEQFRQMYLGWIAHPIFSKTGDYPAIMKERIATVSQVQGFPVSRLPIFTADEIKEIRGACDFIGLNHYTIKLVTFSTNPINEYVPSVLNDINATISYDPKWEKTSMMHFRVTPSGIRKVLTWITAQYGNEWEISITENGYAGYKNDSIDDKRRVNYLNEYLKETLLAISQGCNVVSYIYWSLMDNFEWHWGYTARFGLFQVDFESANRTRTPRASAFVYKKIIETRRINDTYYPHISSAASNYLCIPLLFIILVVFISKQYNL